MLRGNVIRLRTVRESDLDRLYEFHQDIANRGDYFPIGVMASGVPPPVCGDGLWEIARGCS